MMTFRPGQRLIVPGVQVLTPRPSGASTWWDNNGAISGCVAAYAPKGAADLAASYINLANPGTNNAAPGVAPTWDATGGWTFNGSTQYLTTGIIPTNNQTWSAFVRFSNGPDDVPAQLFGSSLAADATPYFGVMPDYSSGLGGLYLNGTYQSVSPKQSGVVGFAGNKVYLDGSAQTGTITSAAGTMQEIYIGCRNRGGTPFYFIDAKIQALAIYSTTLTAGEVATLTTLMNAL